ncbi:MAG: hypothetical protein ACM3SY_21975 [Candidatus Omnitrophota bacterium]
MKYIKYVIAIFSVFLFSIGLKSTTLVDTYKQGDILIQTDPEFGKGVEWKNYLYDIAKEMEIGPDGSIYITNIRQNNISKFSSDGQFIKKFGQGSQGQLNSYGPGGLSILDNKYLVVSNYPDHIRLVDIENTDTQPAKVLKTEHNVWGCTALKNNKIAYICRRFINLSNGDKKRVTDVIIKDTLTGKENHVARYELNYRCRSRQAEMFVDDLPHLFWNVFIERTKDGNLIIGASDRSNIDIFSPEGEKINSFTLDYQPINVTHELHDEIMEKLTHSMKSTTPEGKKRVAEFEKAMSGAELLSDHLPYYTYLRVDSEGNILVFQNQNCIRNCETLFRVYSPEGQYICSTKFNMGQFKYDLFIRLKQIVFTGNGIFGLFNLKDTENGNLQLVKTKLR